MITKKTMEQYEAVRRGGATNMFDYYRVTMVAATMGFSSLARLTRGQYKELLMNFGKLMKKYGIKQERNK